MKYNIPIFTLPVSIKENIFSRYTLKLPYIQGEFFILTYKNILAYTRERVHPIVPPQALFLVLLLTGVRGESYGILNMNLRTPCCKVKWPLDMTTTYRQLKKIKFFFFLLVLVTTITCVKFLLENLFLPCNRECSNSIYFSSISLFIDVVKNVLSSILSLKQCQSVHSIFFFQSSATLQMQFFISFYTVLF